MTHYIQVQPEQEDNFSGDEYSPNAVDDEHSPPFTVTLHINDTPVVMESTPELQSPSSMNPPSNDYSSPRSCAPTLE